MSRSYKKNPYVTDHRRKISKRYKRIANHSFRHRLTSFGDDMPINPQHKKYNESYDICDYKWRMSKEEAIAHYEQRRKDSSWSLYFEKHFPTLESWLKYWYKCYKGK